MFLTLIAFAVALGILITFHELGHYWVARICGVRVLRFSIGFGRVLLRRTDRHGTEWAVSAIPLGGYVKMQDDPPPDASRAEAGRAFNNQSVWRRMAIVVAGPLFNLVLAVVFYAALDMAGTRMPAPILSQPEASSPAGRAGFMAGDRILAIDGHAVASWNDARWRLLDVLSSGGQAVLDVRPTAGGVQRRTLVLKTGNRLDPSQGDPLAWAGLRLEQPPPVVREVGPGSPGQAAGLQVGDTITAVGDLTGTLDASALVAYIQQHAGVSLPMTVMRGGVPISLHVVPRPEEIDGRKVGRIGIMLGGDVPMVTVRYGVLDSVWHGARRTGETAWMSLRMMGRMAVGDVSWRNLSGPVTMADYAGQSARIGLAAYVAYLALISISLGVLNLLPIPLLDGGHLLYYLLEVVRGRPVPERWMQIGQRTGLGLLVCLMGLALFNDFARLFT
ncbi:RIP metalloprotease RseP [Bordetella sp. FB-8]|uniref:RIP metalloprotease RseP n=1 Tax=Bordetella sp. FB-8 TaxID=1159870 RepID=UPI000362EF8A|nr:RIP metalloprotease RseP [Bordetella sp. FB-8]